MSVIHVILGTLSVLLLLFICCAPALLIIWFIGLVAPGARMLPAWCYPKNNPIDGSEKPSSQGDKT